MLLSLLLQDFQRLLKPSGSIVEWPKERVSHSSTIVTSVSSELRKKPHLIVMGGLDENGDVISDCWVMDIESKHWKQVQRKQCIYFNSIHSIFYLVYGMGNILHLHNNRVL